MLRKSFTIERFATFESLFSFLKRVCTVFRLDYCFGVWELHFRETLFFSIPVFFFPPPGLQIIGLQTAEPPKMEST